MEKFEFQRKIEKRILEWNNEANKVPLIVDGLRQVGKSYIVNKFANEHYENVITYDFRHNKVLREIFEGNLDVDSIIMKSAPYFPNKNFVPYLTPDDGACRICYPVYLHINDYEIKDSGAFYKDYHIIDYQI